MGIVRGGAPSRPAIWFSPSWPKTPSVWPGTASLVVMASSVASGLLITEKT